MTHLTMVQWFVVAMAAAVVTRATSLVTIDSHDNKQQQLLNQMLPKYMASTAVTPQRTTIPRQVLADCIVKAQVVIYRDLIANQEPEFVRACKTMWEGLRDRLIWRLEHKSDRLHTGTRTHQYLPPQADKGGAHIFNQQLPKSNTVNKSASEADMYRDPTPQFDVEDTFDPWNDPQSPGYDPRSSELRDMRLHPRSPFTRPGRYAPSKLAPWLPQFSNQFLGAQPWFPDSQPFYERISEEKKDESSEDEDHQPVHVKRRWTFLRLIPQLYKLRVKQPVYSRTMDQRSVSSDAYLEHLDDEEGSAKSRQRRWAGLETRYDNLYDMLEHLEDKGGRGKSRQRRWAGSETRYDNLYDMLRTRLSAAKKDELSDALNRQMRSKKHGTGVRRRGKRGISSMSKAGYAKQMLRNAQREFTNKKKEKIQLKKPLSAVAWFKLGHVGKRDSQSQPLLHHEQGNDQIPHQSHFPMDKLTDNNIMSRDSSSTSEQGHPFMYKVRKRRPRPSDFHPFSGGIGDFAADFALGTYAQLLREQYNKYGHHGDGQTVRNVRPFVGK